MNFIDKIKINSAIKYIKKGNIDKALLILNKIKLLSFDKAFYKGICYYETGKLDKAENYFITAINYKQDYNCIRILAEVYLQKGNWEMALKKLSTYKHKEDIKKIINIIKSEKTRDNYIKHNKFVYYAMQHIRLGEYEESICNYKESLQYTDDRASIYNQIGAIYFNYLKNREIAEEYFYKAYSMCPNNRTFKINYAKAKLTS